MTDKNAYLTLWVIFFVFLVTGGIFWSRIRMENKVLGTQAQNIQTPSPVPTSSPSPKPVVKKQVTSNTEPKIDCRGPDGKVFQATKEECDKFNSAWGQPKTNSNTRTTTNNYNYTYTSTYTPKKYYTCTICGTYTGCQTYNYLVETKEQCDAEQAKMTSLGTSYTLPAPQPTQPPVDNTLACNQAVQDWVSYKENFYATSYNQFTSSAEAIAFLESARQKYQAILSSYGCTNHISL